MDSGAALNIDQNGTGCAINITASIWDDSIDSNAWYLIDKNWICNTKPELELNEIVDDIIKRMEVK